MWKREPEAEQLIETLVHDAPQLIPFAKKLEVQCSGSLLDWLDHIALPNESSLEDTLKKCGFVQESGEWKHPGAQLPRVILSKTKGRHFGIKTDSVAAALLAHGQGGVIEGSPFSSLRKACLFTEEDVSLWVVERRGASGDEAVVLTSKEITDRLEIYELWACRNRELEDFDLLYSLVDAMEARAGIAEVAHAVLKSEREYWESRNRAGQLQKDRQDRLGLGWGNHDHHTFRSSRENFSSLVQLFERLGFHCRERFYAGQEAGWGAQVMENTKAGLILFLDLDLAPEELNIDFAHTKLKELPHLGTIGLWCALHGDSIFQAGMHHLEGQFIFEALEEDLAHLGIGMMDPFSDFPYLKQAFTHGEIWHVAEDRLSSLLSNGKISEEEHDRFKKYGAVGSHLENLQRKEGYKGFNQKNVSTIIKKTDPRSS